MSLDRCRTLFEDSPISLWEGDFSEVRDRLGRLAETHGDLERYLRAHPEELLRCVSLMKILDVNPATLRLFRAESREQLLGSLNAVASQGPGLEETVRSLLSIAAGAPSFETETVHHALDGTPIDIHLRWHVAQGSESDYGRVIVSIIDITTRKQAELALLRSREELRNLAAYQESMREEERTRISREIHDVLGQDLTALKLDLAWMRNRMPPGQDALMRKIESMTALVDSTAKTVRRISKQLRPAMLDDLGLVEAVKLHLREFEERTGIACSLEPSDREMPENREMATAFFRVLQEALTNVARHARATRVEIFLQCDGKFGTLRVTDDGTGIRPEQVASGKSFGLIGIRERVAALGGTATVTGEPGRGTTVEVKVPCCTGGCRC